MNTLDSLVRDGLLPDSMLVRPIREVWIAIRSDGPADTDPLNPQIIGEGTRENPWDGSTARRFDKILNLSNFAKRENVIIHLGPGLFRTGGASSYFSKWRPQSGWKIIGAGKFQTVLLLTGYDLPATTFGGAHAYQLINTDPSFGYLNGFEISDLTLDCGMDDQPLPPDAQNGWPQTATGAIQVNGRNIIIQRVRIINFGTRTPTVINGATVNSWEDYPMFFFGGLDSTDA